MNKAFLFKRKKKYMFKDLLPCGNIKTRAPQAGQNTPVAQ